MSSNEVPHDPVTGEILAAPPHNPYALRSLSAILGALDHGDYAPVLEGALAEIREVLRAAQMREKGASATLTLKLHFVTKSDTDMFGIIAEHTVKLPKTPPAKTGLYMDDQGHFSILHPRQIGLPLGPRVVGSAPTEIRTASAGTTEVRSAGDTRPEFRTS